MVRRLVAVVPPSVPPLYIWKYDVFGHQVAKATQPGAHWDIIHDAQDQLVFEDVRRCGVRGSLQPTHIFSGVLPLRELLPRQRVEQANRRGVVPDQMLQGVPADAADPRPPRDGYRVLFDTKMLHGGGDSHYGLGRARGRSCGAVELRAQGVHPYYVRRAQELDRRHHAADPGTLLTNLLKRMHHGLLPGH